MEEKEKKDLEELRDQALEMKAELGLPSIDTALLMIICQDLDTIRFHNC
ncbi:MAG: hypothetical protein IIA87_03920 [Nanoarchaeota archaeon]|nr:hypothetical protein [Nanoarchaeota archaeon]